MIKGSNRKTKTSASKVPEPFVVPEHRVFLSKRFEKDAAKEGISDKELCEAADKLSKGQGDDLGGNVWKRRLNENRSRSIVVTKPAEFWVFSYLFEKSARDNIDDDELVAFKKLAADYSKKGQAGIDVLVKAGAMKEICNDCNQEV